MLPSSSKLTSFKLNTYRLLLFPNNLLNLTPNDNPEFIFIEYAIKNSDIPPLKSYVVLKAIGLPSGEESAPIKFKSSSTSCILVRYKGFIPNAQALSLPTGNIKEKTWK